MNMLCSPARLYNALWPVSETAFVPVARPDFGLLATHNRMDWLSWAKTETALGVYDWTLADHWVDENLRQGVSPIACLHRSPDWREYNPKNPKAYTDAWWEYCALVATRYKGRVTVWEIGNEFDSPAFEFHGQAAVMGQVWRIAHDVMHSVDPGCTVICGSVEGIGPGGSGLTCLDAALAAFGGPPDAVAVHIYPERYPVSLVTELLHQVRGVMIARGCASSQLMVTEWGMSGLARLSAEAVMAFFVAMISAQRRAGVSLSIFWVLDDDNLKFGGFGPSATFDRVGLWNAALNAINKREDMDTGTTNDPTLMPELTQTQWYAADIAARAALLLYHDAELAERLLRRLLDERRLVQDAASSTAAEHQSTATLAMATAQTLGATNMLLAQAPTAQSQDYIVTELVTAQVIANKPPDLMGAVAMAKTIQQLTFVPRIYPAPV